MKKYLLFGFLGIALIACDENDDQNENNNNASHDFEMILQSKAWTVTNYSDNYFGDFMDGEKCWTYESADPDPCNFGDICSESYTWDSYQAEFTSSNLNATFKYTLNHPDSTDWDNCEVFYSSNENTENYTSDYTYNETDSTLSVNFGNIFDFVDEEFVEQVLNIAYKVKSYSEQQIVLEGSTTVGEETLVREIILQ